VGCDGGVQGVLALVKHRPTLEEVVSWVDEGACALVTVCVWPDAEAQKRWACSLA
jgi:hypothetical protein